MEEKRTNSKLINISQKAFITASIMLVALMILSIVLTYVLPKGAFGTTASGEVDYSTYIRLDGEPGINIFKGLFAPILLLGSSDGITIIMLCVFLLAIAGAFQAMNDSNGIKAIVNKVVNKFKEHRFLLLAILSLIFMLFGAMLGLFEETLTLLPIVVMIAVSLGFDSFTGFLISIVSCGFGFSTAITNPFTVLFASQIIGVNPLVNVWFRILVFLFMYGFMLLWIFLYVKKIKKDPKKSVTYERDQTLKLEFDNKEEIQNESKLFKTYLIFFVIVLGIVILFSSLSALRDYTVVALIAVFLFGGFICASIAFDKQYKKVFKSFLQGFLSVLPSLAFILLASSVKYILVEGGVLPTITNSINNVIQMQNIYVVAFVIFVVVLILEFFISSSTAKAIFVMSILSILSVGLSKETLVLIYTFGDGYTNLLFPTSPVLLIGLSMIGVSYFKWLKHSWLRFIITFLLVLAFIALAILIGY